MNDVDFKKPCLYLLSVSLNYEWFSFMWSTECFNPSSSTNSLVPTTTGDPLDRCSP